MKKLILGIVAAIALANNGNAQEAAPINKTDYREHTMWGVKAGTNYSNVYDSKGESFDADSKFGLAAGGFLSIPIGKYLGIQPEVLYSQKGFRATGQIFGSSYAFTRTTGYLDMPLYVTLKPSEFVTILAGPQYSYLMTQKDVFTNALVSTEQETEFKNDNIRKNTLCVAGGLDLNLKHIVVSGRAGWDLQNNNGDGTSATPRYKNTWLQGTVGFRF